MHHHLSIWLPFQQVVLQPIVSLQEKFFKMLDPNIKRFQLSLNTTRTIFNGVKNISSYGYTEFTIIINDPPENGSCSILGFHQKDQKWLDTSVGLGLVQEFKLNCDNKWVDPNGHKILEYVFKSKWVIPREKNPHFLQILTDDA